MHPDCPEAPPVLHFPLVNDSFREHSAPGEPWSQPLHFALLVPWAPGPTSLVLMPLPPRLPQGISPPCQGCTLSPLGVPRTAEEKEAGEVNLSSSSSPYHYSKVTYSQEDVDKLLRLTHYNICNNREQLLEALREAVLRRRQRRQLQPQ